MRSLPAPSSKREEGMRGDAEAKQHPRGDSLRGKRLLRQSRSEPSPIRIEQCQIFAQSKHSFGPKNIFDHSRGHACYGDSQRVVSVRFPSPVNLREAMEDTMESFHPTIERTVSLRDGFAVGVMLALSLACLSQIQQFRYVQRKSHRVF